jgi:hypothetical protein
MVTLAIGARYEGGSSPAVPFRWETKWIQVCWFASRGCLVPVSFCHPSFCMSLGFAYRHRKTMKPLSKPHMYDRCICCFLSTHPLYRAEYRSLLNVLCRRSNTWPHVSLRFLSSFHILHSFTHVKSQVSPSVPGSFGSILYPLGARNIKNRVNIPLVISAP